MKLVYNRTNNSIVYSDSGQMVAPGEFAYVDDDKYRRIDEAIADGRFVEKPVPSTMPDNVSESAAAALKEAIADRKKDEPVADTTEVADNSDTRSVRNTGQRRNTTTKKKEA